jgi:hypothetical protein
MKKGVVMTTVVLLILLLLSFAALAGWIYQMKQQIDEAGDVEGCRLSVVAAATTHMLSDTFVDIDCPRIQVTVEEEDVVTKDEFRPDLIKKAVADELKNCWFKMGRGTLNGFNNNIIGNIKQDDDYACVVCSSIGFEGAVMARTLKETGSHTIGGFETFLETEPISSTSTQTYSDYLSLQRSHVVRVYPFFFKEVSGTDELVVMDEIDTTSRYHIFYVVHKASTSDSLLKGITDFLGIGESIIKEEDFWASLYVADQSTITKLKCGGGMLN